MLSYPRAIIFDLDCTITDRQRSTACYVAGMAARFAHRLPPVDQELLRIAYSKADGLGYRRKEESFPELLEALPWITYPTLDELIHDWRTPFHKS